MQTHFQAIGTDWQIEIYQSISEKTFNALVEKIKQRIEIFDKTYSRFRADSEISKMKGGAGSYQLPPDSTALFNLYHKLYQVTDGLFTPLVGKLLEEVGYDANYSLVEQKKSQVPTVDSVYTFENQTLTLKQPATLDFGAGGKGYLVDIIAQVITDHQISEFSIDASGDILHKNQTKPLRIGLENPHNSEQIIGVATIQNISLCASATNRRQWHNHHHIFNPKTLESTKDVVASWVVAPSTLLADSLATALFLVTPEVLKQEFAFEYLVLNNTGRVTVSQNFPAELYFKN